MSIPQYKQDLMRLQHLLELADTSDSQVTGLLSNYICILTSGLLEVAVRGCLANFSKVRSEQRVFQFVESELEDFLNPKWEKIQNLLSSFDPAWPPAIEAEIGDEGKDAINSVVNNRHNFAHGRPGSLSLGAMKRYFKQIEKFIGVLERTVS